MAVESRFVVIRQGVEVEIFMDKKAADEYDKMLDMADNLSEMFEQAPIELSEEAREELSVYLAQNRENVLVALQAKKAKAQHNKSAGNDIVITDNSVETNTVNGNESDKATKKEQKNKATGTKAASKKPVSKDKLVAA